MTDELLSKIHQELHVLGWLVTVGVVIIGLICAVMMYFLCEIATHLLHIRHHLVRGDEDEASIWRVSKTETTREGE